MVFLSTIFLNKIRKNSFFGNLTKRQNRISCDIMQIHKKDKRANKQNNPAICNNAKKGTASRNFHFFVLCRKQSIPQSAPTPPKKNAAKSRVLSEMRHFPRRARRLSSAYSAKETAFRKRYVRISTVRNVPGFGKEKFMESFLICIGNV